MTEESDRGFLWHHLRQEHTFVIVLIAILMLLSVFVSKVSYAESQTNVTMCHNGNCTTTICIDNEPCKTTNSNSTNGTIFGNPLENKTISLPEEVV